MKMGIILLYLIFIIEETICNFKKKKSKVLFDASIIYKLPITSLFLCYLVIRMTFFIVDIIGAGLISVLMIPLFFIGGALIAMLYGLYKGFTYKQIIVNTTKKEVVEEVVYKAFEKYNYELKEIIEYDERELVIKNIGSSIVIKENKRHRCMQIEISKYKKIKYIDEIVMNMKKLLIEEYKVEKDFNVKKCDFLDPIIFPIIGYGVFIVSDMYSKRFNPLVGDIIFPTIFPIIVYGIFKIRDKCFKES